MTPRARLLLGTFAWLVFISAAAILLARDQAQEREGLDERFAARADTGAEFVSAYVDDVFTAESRVISGFPEDIAPPRRFVAVTELIGFEAAVVLDRQGRLLAVAPASPEMIGSDMTDRPHLAAALAGERAVSDVTPSAVEGKPIVAFAQPIDDPELAVYSAGYDLSDSPLKAQLERQPIAGTWGYLLDSSGRSIVFAGDGAVETLGGDPTQEGLAGPVVTDDRVIAASRVPGTPWVYRLDAPRESLLAPVRGASGEWVFLGVFALVGLAGVAIATQATAAREQARREKAAADHQLRLTVEHAPIGMAMLDLEQRFVEPNARLCEMLNQTPDELVQLTLKDVTHADDVDLDTDLVDQLLAGSKSNYEVVRRLVRKDGAILYGRASVSLIWGATGLPEHFVAQIEDVTQIRAAQDELQHRALYDSLTQLANRGLLLDRLQAAPTCGQVSVAHGPSVHKIAVQSNSPRVLARYFARRGGFMLLPRLGSRPLGGTRSPRVSG